MRIKKIISQRLFTLELDSLLDIASNLLEEAQHYKKEVEDKISDFIKLVNSYELEEKEYDELYTKYKNTIDSHQKFNKAFYQILKHKNIPELEEKLNFRLKNKKDTRERIKYKYVETEKEEDPIYLNFYDSKNTKNLYTTNKDMTEGWVILESRKDECGKPIKTDEGEYIFQYEIEGRTDIETFLPAFKEIIQRDKDFQSLREAIKNIEEIIAETKLFLSQLEDATELLRIKLSEDEESLLEKNLSHDLEKYIELKNQI